MTLPTSLSPGDFELPEADPTADAEMARDSETETPPHPSGQDLGWWLTHPNAQDVRKAVLDRWKDADAFEAKRNAKERRNELLMIGMRGVQVVADDEEDRYSVRVPFGASDAPSAPNKAAQLLGRVVSTLTVDPPSPDCAPNSDAEEERAAASLAERVLRVEGAPAKRDDTGLLRRALNLASAYATCYGLTTWNARAAGLVPLEIQAHPQAQTTADALNDPVPDPTTGQIVPADQSTLVTRYVRLDNTLTDVSAEAQMVWAGDVVESLLFPSQVRPIPTMATRVEDADGVLVGRVMTLSQLLAECYDGERPDESDVKRLVEWKPDGWKQWLPRALRETAERDTPKRPDGTIAESALVCTLTLYWRSCGEAPLGAEIVVTGAPEPHTRKHRQVTIGEGQRARSIVLGLPLAQCTWSEDTGGGDPKGTAGIEDLAAYDQIRTQALKYVLDYMDRFGSPRTYLPMDSTMQPGDVGRGDRSDPIRILPGSEPHFEKAPPMSPVMSDVYEGMGTEMNTASGLEEAAQGVSSGSVKSGVHAQQIIEQALVALAGTKQNADRFICRLWRNRIEYWRAYLDVPRQLQALGEAGDVQLMAFRGVDLMGAGDVTIARGSNTMMPRSAKTAMAREELQMALTTGDQLGALRYQRAVTGNTGPLLGVQDDPHRARITRQVQQWKDAAKQQHPAAPPTDPNAPPTVAGVDPNGVPILGPPQPPPDPVAAEAAQIFAPNPTDELPMVAPIRFAELSDLIASRAFLTADARYQQSAVAEYERMRQAAGVMTRAEQAQAAQQQAMQQQQMAQQEAQAKEAGKVADDERQFAMKRAEKTAATQDDMRVQGALEQQRMAMQGAAQTIQPQQGP